MDDNLTDAEWTTAVDSSVRAAVSDIQLAVLYAYRRGWAIGVRCGMQYMRDCLESGVVMDTEAFIAEGPPKVVK